MAKIMVQYPYQQLYSHRRTSLSGPRWTGLLPFLHLNVRRGRLRPPRPIEFDRLNFGVRCMFKKLYNYLPGLEIHIDMNTPSALLYVEPNGPGSLNWNLRPTI